MRERLVAGDTDEEVIDFVTDRYGEYVLLQPRTGGTNMILWLAGPAMLLLAFGIGFAYVRKRGQGQEEVLSTDEEARLKEILDR